MEPTVSDFKADEQIDSLVTLLEMAGVNVDASIVSDWTAGDMQQAEAWANRVIELADAVEAAPHIADVEEHLIAEDGYPLPEIPNCLVGWMETARQIGGTAGCVRELIEDRKHWAELDGDAAEQEAPNEPERTDMAKTDTSTLEPPKKFRQKTLPVTFGGCSVGKTLSRITFSVPAAKLTLEEAKALLCTRRLTVTLKTGDGQKQLDGMEDDQWTLERVSGDTKNLTVQDESFATGFSFNRNELERGELEKFCFREGRLVIHDVADIPDDAKKPGRKKASENGDGDAEGDRTVFGDDGDEDE